MSAFYSYLVALTAAALFAALLQPLIPKGTAGRAARLCCGLVIVLSALTPVLRLSSRDIAAWFTRMELAQDEALSGIAVQNKHLKADIISSRVQAYVLDKAQALGLEIEAEVHMNESGTLPYPDGIRIHGTLTAAQKQLLQRYIAESFGIPEDRQEYGA